jgi:hypothetical protein
MTASAYVSCVKNSQNFWLSVGVSQSASEMANLLNKERGTWEENLILLALKIYRTILCFDIKDWLQENVVDPEFGSGTFDRLDRIRNQPA